MDSIGKVHGRHQPLHLSLIPHRSSFLKPISSLSFRISPLLPSSSSPFKLSSVRASSSSQPRSSCSGPLYQTQQTRKSSFFQTLNPLLKTCITLTAAAAVLLARLHNKPAIASPVANPVVVESTNQSSRENLAFEEQEKTIEKSLAQNPNDIEALRSLMEVRIKSRKLVEAIEVIDRLIALEPNDNEWPLLKSQIYIHSGDFDSARKGFEEILAKDPLRVEAYHGLLMAYSESGDSLNELLKRIEVAMNQCKKEKRKSDLRDFKLLIAQVRVMEEKYGDALRVYEELAKEEPRDFRPYLCQGIIYTLLRKKDEAEKKFEQFRKLVPKNHPYREYFLDNMFATKFFSEKVAREGERSRS